jgi:MATE family multidrug resistance protein
VVDLSVPIAISMFSFGAMTLVDTLLVGHLGPTELAAVGLGGTVALALLAFSTGIFRIMKVRIASELGAGRSADAADVVGGGLLLGPLLGLLTVGIGVGLLPLLGHLGGEEVAGKTATYFLTRLVAAPLVLTITALREARHGFRDSRTAMRAALIANGVNLVFDIFFLYVLRIGVLGAGLATWTACTTEGVLLARAHRGVGFNLRGAIRQAVALLRTGLPSGVQSFLELSAGALMGILIARTGQLEMAGHQVAGQLAQLSLIPSIAVSEAGAVLAARAVGTSQQGRIRVLGRSALFLAAGWASACLLLFLLAGPVLVKGISSDSWVQAIAGRVVIVAALVHLANAPNQVARGMLRGLGDIRTPALYSVCFSWMTTLPLAWFLGVELWMGALGGWLGLGAEVLIGATVFWSRFESGCGVQAPRPRRSLSSWLPSRWMPTPALVPVLVRRVRGTQD